jgi:hypothetical protein
VKSKRIKTLKIAKPLIAAAILMGLVVVGLFILVDPAARGSTIILRNVESNPIRIDSLAIGNRRLRVDVDVVKSRPLTIAPRVYDAGPLIIVGVIGSEKQQVMCTVDNAERPCVFEIVIRESGLSCAQCEKFR